MEIISKYYTKQKYLPTKRHRKERVRIVENTETVTIREISESEFPIAFIVHDYQSVCENAKKYKDFRDDSKCIFKVFSEKVRTFNGRLFKPVRYSYGAAISTLFEEPAPYLKHEFEEYEPSSYWYTNYSNNTEFSEKSILLEDNICEKKQELLEKTKHYVICNGVVWKGCEEPMYLINTFGLGHNHGETGFFIQYSYNSNISNKNYFNALQREQAIAYGKQIALNRGDTDSVEGLGDGKDIEVFMPEMVKRNPQKEHGEGDSFMNSLETMIQGTSSSAEAGLLAVCMTNLAVEENKI